MTPSVAASSACDEKISTTLPTAFSDWFLSNNLSLPVSPCVNTFHPSFHISWIASDNYRDKSGNHIQYNQYMEEQAKFKEEQYY